MCARVREFVDSEKLNYSEFVEMLLWGKIRLSDVLAPQSRAWFYSVLEPVPACLMERNA